MKAVLFIHGLSAKNEDNKYFIDYMKKKINIAMYSFTLPGHERDKMSKVRYREWLQKSEEKLKEILKKHKKVIIVSHSMGSIIAVNLASRYREVEKLVLISPAFYFGNLKQNKEDLKRLLKKEIDSELGTGFEGALTKLKTVPSSVWLEYRKMALVNIKNIERIKCPTLVIYGSNDNLVSKKAVMYVYDRLKCKKDFLLVDKIRHQVFKSSKKQIITKYIYRYIAFNTLYKLSKKETI